MKPPRVAVAMAMSVDGKTSTRARHPVTFTSAEDKRHLLALRSRCDALIVAARTARDYETMGIPRPHLRARRARDGRHAHPVRVIVSANLNLPRNLRVLTAHVSPLLIVCCETAPSAKRDFFSRHARLLVCGRRELDARKLVSILANEYGAREILCEGGATLNDAFFRAGLVKELHLTLVPDVVGGRNAPTIADGKGFSKLRHAANGKLVSLRKGKREWFLKYTF